VLKSKYENINDIPKMCKKVNFHLFSTKVTRKIWQKEKGNKVYSGERSYPCVPRHLICPNCGVFGRYKGYWTVHDIYIILQIIHIFTLQHTEQKCLRLSLLLNKTTQNNTNRVIKTKICMQRDCNLIHVFHFIR